MENTGNDSLISGFRRQILVISRQNASFAKQIGIKGENGKADLVCICSNAILLINQICLDLKCSTNECLCRYVS